MGKRLWRCASGLHSFHAAANPEHHRQYASLSDGFFRNSHITTLFLILFAIPSSGAEPPRGSVTKVLNSGNDGLKLNIAVLAEGYSSSDADQSKFNSDVDSLLLNGVFGHDFYKLNKNAFNIYRVNLISNQTGVSKRVYNENGTPFDPSDDAIASDAPRDTALKFIWSGSWAHCWLEYSDDTEALLDAALSQYVPTYNYVLVILNQDAYGGCGGGGRQYVPRGVSWDVIAHEYGHGIGGLLDEYFNPSTTYSGSVVNGPNVASVSDRTTVAWHDLILPSTPVPTTLGVGVDPNQTVGEFLGGGTFEKGLYRPVDDCRMRSNSPPYCPVCARHLQSIVGPHLSSPTPAGPAPITHSKMYMTVPLELRGATEMHASSDDAQRNNRGKPADATAKAAGMEPESYLHLVLRVNRAGEAKLVSAAEVPGVAVISNAKVGNYAYEVTQKGNESVIIHSLPDPFEGRAFPSPPTAQDPNGKPEGHHELERPTTDVVVRIPRSSLDSAIDKEYAIKFYAINPGKQHYHKMDQDTMRALRGAERLQMTTDVPANQLGPQLRAIGKKIAPR